MKSAYEVLDEIGDQQGWNDQSKLALALEYIENQKANDAWADFLRQQADLENS